jgi:hypothetical protein
MEGLTTLDKHYYGYSGEQKIRNMQKLKIKVENYAYSGGQALEDCSTQTETTSVFFRNLEEELIQLILKAQVVIGCVAWLTNERILQALSKVKGVSIIVQKEDLLRPDIASDYRFAEKLRVLYQALPGTLDRQYDFDTILSQLNYCTDGSIEAVRCVGNYNQDKSPSFPRSHHKFVLFCDYEDDEDGQCDSHIRPYAVWTGSYNFTKTAGESFENALVLREEEIIQAYYHEYSQIAALSEPLNWETPWCAPEWRIGT